MLRMTIECDSPGCQAPLFSTAAFRPGEGLEKVNDLKSRLTLDGWLVDDRAHLCPEHRPNGKTPPP